MALITCSECGKEISDKAPLCIGCGAPVALPSITPEEIPSQPSTLIGDLNGDGKVDFEDFKIALSRSKQYASDKVESAVSLAKEKLRSAKEKDAAAVEDLFKDFDNNKAAEKTASEVTKDRFKSALATTIDVKFAEIMSAKKDAEAYLNFVDAQIMTAKIRRIFLSALKITPPQVEAACLLSEAILAPSMKEKENNLRAAVGIAGGTTGIGLVIGAIGSSLGWGVPAVVALFKTLFVPAIIAAPIAVGVAGLSIAAFAGYFASTSNKQTDTERFLLVLKNSTGRAVDVIWDQYETELSGTVTQVVSDIGAAR